MAQKQGRQCVNTTILRWICDKSVGWRFCDIRGVRRWRTLVWTLLNEFEYPTRKSNIPGLAGRQAMMIGSGSQVSTEMENLGVGYSIFCTPKKQRAFCETSCVCSLWLNNKPGKDTGRTNDLGNIQLIKYV
jgi:hypothetical protein